MSQDLVPAVAWDRLHHHYGTAEDVPALLRAAATDARAFGELDNRISHQGGCVLSAAPPVLPALLRCAADPAVGHRAAVVDLVGRLAEAGRTAEPRYVTPTWPAAWAAAVPRLLDLVTDPDPVVRRRIAFPLAQAHEHACLVLPALVNGWHRDTDEAARVGFVCAAAELLRDMATEWPAPVVDWLSDLRSHPDAVHRFAGAMAHRRSGLGGRDPRHVDEAIAYLPTADPLLWHHVWAARRPIARLVRWTADVLDDDRDGRTRLAAALLRLGHEQALTAAWDVLSRWRSPAATLLPLVAERLSDPDPARREQAAEVLGATGRAAEPWHPDLVAAARDEVPAVRKAAVLALAGAPESVALVADLLDHGPVDHDLRRSLRPLRPFAATLLPLLRRRLAEADDFAERRDYLLVLAHWGPDAVEAAPEVTAQIGTDVEEWALDALVSFGLSDICERPEPDAPVRSAVRYWRATGDTELLLDRLRADDPTLVRHLDVLAELGPAAADLAAVLRTTRTSGWDDARRLRTLWRITGDPADATGAAMAVWRALTTGGPFGRYLIECIGRLAELGPLAEPAVPVLRELLEQDTRPGRPDRRCGIRDDDLLCDAIRAVLAGAA
ncbi:HEAT repeat domain-containing protein [Lentzea chajnantorensis]